jgi:3-dehydro-4-phosphotetronate decarboxylase
VTEEARLREIICELAKSLFDRGLTHGSTGNISARTPDGGLLVSPTGTSFGRLDDRQGWIEGFPMAETSTRQGFKDYPIHQSISDGHLDPSRLSRFDAEGRHVSGDQPTKEMPLHSAFYDTRSQAGAVVHLHSCHAVAWSMMPEVDDDDLLPPLTPYAIMQLGRVKLLPFFRPGDPAMGDAVRGLAGKRSAVMLANHGPVVAGKDVEATCNAIEELEATARLAMLTCGCRPRMLKDAQILDIVTNFNVEWEA